MSVRRIISTLPDTRRTFESGLNDLSLIRGVFISKKTFSFTSTDFESLDAWLTALQNGDIIPVYYVQEHEDLSEATQYKYSQQDFTYMLRRGKYRHVFKFDFTNDRHNTLDLLTGSDLYVFYWDMNWNIYGYNTGSEIRGFRTNRIILEKQGFVLNNVPAFSALDIEWRDSSELNYIKKVTWNPRQVDREFISISIEYADSDSLNFSAKYLSTNIEDIEQSGVSVTDNANGELTFTQYNYLGGVYRLSGFNQPLTKGILQIISNLYLGCAVYTVTIQAEVSTYLLYEDDDTFMLEGSYDGDLLILENQ